MKVIEMCIMYVATKYLWREIYFTLVELIKDGYNATIIFSELQACDLSMWANTKMLWLLTELLWAISVKKVSKLSVICYSQI